MGMKMVYNCDICREEKKPNDLVGLNFVSNTKFKLDSFQSTDGVHICKNCIQQLEEQLCP